MEGVVARRGEDAPLAEPHSPVHALEAHDALIPVVALLFLPFLRPFYFLYPPPFSLSLVPAASVSAAAAPAR